MIALGVVIEVAIVPSVDDLSSHRSMGQGNILPELSMAN